MCDGRGCSQQQCSARHGDAHGPPTRWCGRLRAVVQRTRGRLRGHQQRLRGRGSGVGARTRHERVRTLHVYTRKVRRKRDVQASLAIVNSWRSTNPAACMSGFEEGARLRSRGQPGARGQGTVHADVGRNDGSRAVRGNKLPQRQACCIARVFQCVAIASRRSARGTAEPKVDFCGEDGQRGCVLRSARRRTRDSAHTDAHAARSARARGTHPRKPAIGSPTR